MLFPPNRAENRRIWCFSRRNLPNRAGKIAGKLEIAARRSLFGQVGLNGFWRKGTETEPPASGFEALDQVRPPELSDRVVTGQVRAGWTCWAGRQVRWTALVWRYVTDPNEMALTSWSNHPSPSIMNQHLWLWDYYYNCNTIMKRHEFVRVVVDIQTQSWGIKVWFKGFDQLANK